MTSFGFAAARSICAVAPPSPAVVGRSNAGNTPPLASLSAIPARAAIQRKCDACANEDSERMPVQPRLQVGPAGDRYEVEADRIAERMMRGGEASGAAPAVQRARSGSTSRDEQPGVRRLGDESLAVSEKENEEKEVRARPARDGEGGATIGASEADLTGGGAPLHAATREFFEQRMGRDLSDVRVHEGEGAQHLNQSIGARAFTYKNHIWLNRGESAGVSFTLAHELAHVLQQTAPGPVGDGSASVAPATIQRDLTPPGNCIQGVHDEMQREVKAWCDHPSGRACVAGESCNRLRQKIRRNQMCARNRRRINDICYAGGNLGHRIAERDARRAQANCMALFRAQCERRPTVPVPVPVPEQRPETRPVPETRPNPIQGPQPVPVPVPVAPRSTWDAVAEWAREVVESGEDATRAAERFLAENPALAGTIVAAGVVAIIALVADDATLVGIADDVLIPIIAALEWVAVRVMIFGPAALGAAGGR